MNARRVACVATMATCMLVGVIWFLRIAPRAAQAGYLVAAPTAGDPAESGTLSRLGVDADRGDINAAVDLAKLLRAGTPPIRRDLSRAHDLFARAATAGHPSALYHLGSMSLHGEGTERDATAAARWFALAADKGSPHAMFMLANAYRAGLGIARDEAQAINWYQRAADLELPEALQALSLAHDRGELGLAVDRTEAARFAMELEHASRHPPRVP